MSAAPALNELLERHGAELLRYLERRAGRLLRFETGEDLLQGIHVRALERGGGFHYQGLPQFRVWMKTVANRYLADRIAYWTALRRRPAALLRLTSGAASQAGAVGEPATTRTGPATFAERREALEAAVRALHTLLPRDREILQRCSAGHTIHELATALGLGYDAAEKARSRALERFRKAYRLADGPD